MNIDVFTQLATPEIQLHWVTAVLAFIVGIVIFCLRKGSPLHRWLGWSYVVLMFITAGSAFFIRSETHTAETGLFEGMSLIHLFIPLTVVGLTRALIGIRGGNVNAHKAAMIGTFVGALIIAGAFTFLPGRLQYLMFFGDPAEIAARLPQ